MDSKNFKVHDEILLLDSTITKKELKTINKNYKKIITFDIISDRLLTANKISHITSDDFLNISELKQLDSLCLDFCQWYDHNNGNNLLLHENINLGSLFRVEFHNFLIPIIKNFFLINKLNGLYPNTTFVCSGNIFKISLEIGMNSTSLNNKSHDLELTWDEIQYNITDSISLKISKENLNKLKNISSTISNIVLKSNLKKNSKNKIALIEFDAIKYEKIFNESNAIEDIVYLYNRHRPIFYNKQSLKIIRNSNIIPYSEKQTIKKLHSNIQNSYEKLLTSFDEFLSNDDFFQSFFTIEKTSFWKFIKSNFINIYKKKLLESIREIEYAKLFLKNYNIDSVIILSESGFTEQIIINLAKNLSKKVILLQHGIIIDNPDAEKYNRILTGVLPINSDYFFNWGNISSKNTINSTSIKKIKSIGSPSLDNISLNDNQISTNSKNILLLATGPRNHQSVGYDANMWKNYESIIKSIYDSVSKYDLNLIIKRHPDMAETDFSPELYSHLKNAKIKKNDKLPILLKNSKIVLSLGISSGILESQINDNPVISILVDYDMFGTTEYISNSCYETNIENLDKILDELVNNPNSFDNLVRKGRENLKKNIDNIGFSSRILFENMKKL